MNDELKITVRPTDQIRPNPRNARTHSKAQIRQLARSIQMFGFINPVVTDADGMLVAGHARWLAALELGLPHLPTICVDHLDEAQLRAYMLADNRIAEDARWDRELLRVELEYLSRVDIDVDVDLTGFSVAETDLILGATVPADDEEVLPAVRPAHEAVTHRRDVWQLGPHRIVCGDARDRETFDLLMDGERAAMVLTDPPYNVPIDGHVSGLGRMRHAEFEMAVGEMSPDEFRQFLQGTLGHMVAVSRPGSVHYVFMDWRHAGELLQAGSAIYGEQLNLCVWAKTNGGMGSLYRSQHELVFVFKKGREPHSNNVELGRNGRYRTNVWTYPGANSFGTERSESLRFHPTVKPVQLLADAMLDVSRRNDIVLDGFLGSGSTLLAAERTGRICYGVEIDPGYVDCAIERWQKLTGQLARCATADGKTMEELLYERQEVFLV